MRVKDPIEFVGGIDKAKSMVLRMEKYIKSSPPLRNCWVSYGGGECFIMPYQGVYSTSYKRLKAAINEPKFKLLSR